MNRCMVCGREVDCLGKESSEDHWKRTGHNAFEGVGIIFGLNVRDPLNKDNEGVES